VQTSDWCLVTRWFEKPAQETKQMTAVSGTTGSPSDKTQLKGRDIAIDYLRAFVIVLVVFLHAALAYTSFSTYDETRWVDSSAPVVDASRWPFLDWFVLFYDRLS
jgi:hypothetical protein